MLTSRFRWALTNPHLSLHIPASSRLAISTQRKRNGHPRRPPSSLSSIVSNLHLLLNVPSFARWPLNLHFFAPEMHTAWKKWCLTAAKPLRQNLTIVTDFKPEASIAPAETSVNSPGNPTEETVAPWGIHALPLDHDPIKEYVTKGKTVFDFEMEGACVVCQQAIASGNGLHALCPNAGCNGVGHLSCWSNHLLPAQESGAQVLPIQGQCPKCHGEVHWGLMMKELTLRMRGQKDIEKLLKEKRKKRAPASKGQEK
jgi:structure-specific endonuclease subunit SLX1